MTDRIDTGGDAALEASLQLVRSGTAFFCIKLAELKDAEFSEPSLLPGWTRAHLVAHVAQNARGVARLTRWAATGVETLMYEPGQRDAELEHGGSLPAAELRDLSDEGIAHLNAAWRGLPADAWTHEVKNGVGSPVPASVTPWMRAREVWLHALDLNNGATVNDLPAEFNDRLLPEIVALWKTRGDEVPSLVLRASDRTDVVLPLEAEATNELVGPAAQLLGWVTGRGHAGLALSSGGEIPVAPRWL